MKKNLFYYLFAVICSVTLFTACSDDDEDTTWQQIPEITNDNVTLTLNDKTPANATVTFDIINAESGKLTLKDVIYGHPIVDVNVTLQKKDDTSYNFTGTTALEVVRLANLNSPLQVKVSGTVDTTGKMSVDVTTSGWAAISGIYANDSLAVTVNGKKQSSTFGVTLDATTENTAHLTFSKITGIVNDFEMDVTLKDGKIEGSQEKETGYLISVTGDLTGAKLTLDVTTSGWATVSGSYYATGNNLTFNGKELPAGGSFSIKMTAEDKADINFSGLLSGSRTGDIKGASVTAKDNVYTIKGSSDGKGYKLSFEGTLDAAHVLTAAATYTTTSSIVGTWTPKIISSPVGNMVATDIKFVTNSGSVKFGEGIINMLPEALKPMFAEEMPDAQVVQMLQALLGNYAMYLQSLTFTEDGRFIVQYINMPKDTNGDGKIDANDMADTTVQSFDLFKYYIGADDKLYLTVSLSDLMGMLPMNDAAKAAWDPSTVLTEGIPFNFSVDGNTAVVSINQDVLNTETVKFAGALLEMFGPMIPGFAEQTQLINTVMGALTTILSDTKEINAGMIFDKK